VIVAAEHRRWWQDEVAELSAENVIVQPANRGTAAGLLLPALSVLERDPDARILVVPSDHFVEKEYVLEVSLRLALDSLWDVGGGVILLGMRPDVPETDYGWIVPGRTSRRVKPIEAFVEKPGRARALELMRRNGLWNSFLLAADCRSLLSLFRKHAPGLLEVFQTAFQAPPSERSAALEELYADLASVDFSRHVLEREDHLLTAEVPACGWTDLGTPARVAQCLRRLGGAAPPPVPPRARTHEHEQSAFSLARALGDGAHGGEGSLAVGV
jgi:mannose-1-phosphate guanylyltransferase